MHTSCYESGSVEVHVPECERKLRTFEALNAKMHICIYIYLYMYVCMYIICIYIYIYICIYIYLRIYVHLYLHVYMYMYAHTYSYTCMYIYVYIGIRIPSIVNPPTPALKFQREGQCSKGRTKHPSTSLIHRPIFELAFEIV